MGGEESYSSWQDMHIYYVSFPSEKRLAAIVLNGKRVLGAVTKCISVHKTSLSTFLTLCCLPIGTLKQFSSQFITSVVTEAKSDSFVVVGVFYPLEYYSLVLFQPFIVAFPFCN